MASQADLLLKREPAVTRLPRVVRVAATLEMGHTAAPVVAEPWDGRRPPTDLQLLGLLTRFNAGEKLPIFVHRDNAYSAAPQDLVRGRRQAPGTGRAVQGSCYFYSEPAPTKAGKRIRKVPGGTWHPEGGPKPISDVASKKSFSYLVQIHRGKQRTGWIMAEISLHTLGDGHDHMVLCVVHKSMHKYPDTSMAAGRSAQVSDEEVSVHDPRGLPGGDISSPPPVPATPQPAPSISSAATTNLLLQKAADKAASWDFEMVCEIQEFMEFKQLHLRTIDLLGQDRSIVSGSLGKLEVLLKHIAIRKKLTPDERDDVMSCGDDMSTTISMAYLNALGNRLQKEFSALGRIGFNVHNQASNRTSKVKDIFMLVHDTEDKEYKQNLYSASAPLQDGVKRKADDHNHRPEAPPSVRQLQRTDANSSSVVQDMTYISALKELERELLANTVMPPDVAGYLEDPMEFDGGGLWAGEAGEHAEIAECSTAPRRVPAEERTEMNCIALKTSRLSGVNYVGCGGPQYCFGVDSAFGDDEALLAAGSQPQL